MAGLFMGLFVSCFLLYFRPFGLARDLTFWSTGRVAFFGLITLMTFWFFELILPLLLPTFFEDRNWRVWHRIGYYLLMTLVIATLNGLYINYLQDLAFNWRNYRIIITQTMVLGWLPITMIVLYRYNAKMVRYLQEAEAIQEARPQVQRQPQAVPSPSAPFVPLAAEAFGNYVKLYYVNGEELRRETERTTLQQVVDQYAQHGFIRCHRSYAVALPEVRHVSGNAQGLRLLVGHLRLEIPVSRKHLAEVRKALV